MFKNKIIRRLALILSLIMLLTSTVGTTFCFIVTKTDSIINTFVPFDSVINNLVITKTVEHPFGDEYVIPDNISFDFKVDLGSIYGNTTIKTSSGDVVADENGSIQVTVKPYHSFAIEGIDAGTKVTVTELQKEGSGFSVKDGVASMEGVLTENGSLKFEYTNVYTPASVYPVNLTVVGAKILEGRRWQDGDSFEFEIEQKTGEDTWTSLGTKTVTYDADNAQFNRFDFSDLVQAVAFDEVGVYEFRMTEIIGNLENIDYDESVNTFAVKVTDVDMDGKLEIHSVTAAQNAKLTETDGGYQIDITFNNTFVPAVPDIPSPEDITVDISVIKTVKNLGKKTIGADGFEFVLENTVSGEKLALRSDKNGEAVFALNFTASDVGKTFTYKLSETDEGIADVTYDTRVYDISVSIALSEDNKLVATAEISGEPVETIVASFENTYQNNGPATPPTGDNGSIVFWIVLMIISGLAFVALAFLDRRYVRS